MVNIITILVDVIARKTKCNSHSIKNYLFNRKNLKKNLTCYSLNVSKPHSQPIMVKAGYSKSNSQFNVYLIAFLENIVNLSTF